MNKKELKKSGASDLSLYMAEVIEDLKREGKYPAVHTYISTLHSFAAFSGGCEVKMPMRYVFTPGRLKEYETGCWCSVN